MEVGDVRAYRLDHFTAFLDVVGVVAVRVQADVGHGGTNHLFAGIQHGDAAATCGQLACYFRVKYQGPGVHGRIVTQRSEERRVGKECRYRWLTWQEKEK